MPVDESIPKIHFRLTREERDLIVNQAVALDSDLIRLLQFGVLEGRRLGFDLDLRDFEDLVDALASEANHAETRPLRRRFSRLYDQLSKQLDATLESIRDPEAFTLTGPTAAFGLEAQKALRGIDPDDLDEVNRILAELGDKHNRQPQADFCGLSPLEVSRLIYVRWDDPRPSVLLNKELSFDEVKHAPILSNARLFLTMLTESGGTKATAKLGNLNQRFVRAMTENMTLAPGHLDELRWMNKVWNELDVFPLHILRVLLEMARLIRKYRGAFLITKTGAKLLQEGNAGALYVRLFRTCFHEFNLAYFDRAPEYPDIQATFSYSLCVAGRLAKDWISKDDFSEQLLLPAVADAIPMGPYGIDWVDFLVRSRFVEPLVQFGLLECHYLETTPGFTHSIVGLKASSLYSRFVQFDLTEA